MMKRREVRLEFKLMNWSYMNFEMRLPTTTYLFAIKKRLEERHGAGHFLICKDAFAEQNEMTDDMKTLEDYGIFQDALVYYEFTPDHDDSLLLHLTRSD